MMIQLWLMAAALVLAGMGFILFPLLGRTEQTEEVSDRESNVAYFNEQNEELAAQVQQGIIPASEADIIRSELEKKLLNDVTDNNETGSYSFSRNKPLALFLAALLPVTAVPLYLKLGATPELAITRLLARPEIHSAEILPALEQWRTRRPDNAQALYMLGSRYLSAGQHDQALEAFYRLYDVSKGAPQASAQLAQALYVAADYQVTETVRHYYRETLQKDGKNAIALGLSGVDAFASEEYQQAIQIWNKALDVETDAAVRQMLTGSINEAKQKLGMPVAQVQIQLSLAPELASLPPETRIFIFARETGDSIHPLAVIPTTAGNLPGNFILDDSATRIMGGTSLTGIEHLDIIARVSLSGDVSQGDYQATARGC